MDDALVVNVLDARAARTVRAAGARARVIQKSSVELQQIVDLLGQEHMPPGSSWGIDPQADAVVVEVPACESPSVAARYGDAVIIRHDTAPARSLIGAEPQQAATAPPPPADLYGGLTINRSSPGGFTCTSGFLVTDANVSGGFKFDYLLTAGHCGKVNSVWYRGSSKIGFMSDRELGPNDFGTIALTNNTVWRPQPWAFTTSGPQPVNGEGQVSVTGTTVCMRGARSHYNCGQVTAFNTGYVDSATGIQVSGLDKTALCAVPGDSGAPVMVPQGNGVLGVGLVSGGATTNTGACQNVTWVEPLWKALNGVELVTSP